MTRLVNTGLPQKTQSLYNTNRTVLCRNIKVSYQCSVRIKCGLSDEGLISNMDTGQSYRVTKCKSVKLINCIDSFRVQLLDIKIKSTLPGYGMLHYKFTTYSICLYLKSSILLSFFTGLGYFVINLP